MALSRADLEAAAALIRAQVPPTPQHHWPTLSRRLGAEVWVKHENHAPTGAFKVRGGITFVDWLCRTRPDVPGVVTATRGNHGQSIARAARARGLAARIVVPRGNAREKNAAMRAWGADLVEHGDDFDAAREEAHRIAEAEGLAFVPPFHPELVRGVATAGFELLTAVPDLDSVYVPIGCGSGICGLIAARNALGLATPHRRRRQHRRAHRKALGRGRAARRHRHRPHLRRRHRGAGAGARGAGDLWPRRGAHRRGERRPDRRSDPHPVRRHP